MLLCKECRKTIADTGRNPTIHYSTCIDCGNKYEKEQRLINQVPNDHDIHEDGTIFKIEAE